MLAVIPHLLRAREQMDKEMPAKEKNRQKPIQTPQDQIHLVASILTIGVLPKDLPVDKPNAAGNIAVRTYRGIVRSLLRAASVGDDTETDQD